MAFWWHFCSYPGGRNGGGNGRRREERELFCRVYLMHDGWYYRLKHYEILHDCTCAFVTVVIVSALFYINPGARLVPQQHNSLVLRWTRCFGSKFFYNNHIPSGQTYSTTYAQGQLYSYTNQPRMNHHRETVTAMSKPQPSSTPAQKRQSIISSNSNNAARANTMAGAEHQPSSSTTPNALEPGLSLDEGTLHPSPFVPSFECIMIIQHHFIWLMCMLCYLIASFFGRSAETNFHTALPPGISANAR